MSDALGPVHLQLSVWNALPDEGPLDLECPLFVGASLPDNLTSGP